ncbi:MAG TPA: hypothetical protein VJB60_01870 [Candidatus Peribacterales bacterium]|nr:hypothetical protein [Candidatus Peribacterales bacterium]
MATRREIKENLPLRNRYEEEREHNSAVNFWVTNHLRKAVINIMRQIALGEMLEDRVEEAIHKETEKILTSATELREMIAEAISRALNASQEPPLDESITTLDLKVGELKIIARAAGIPEEDYAKVTIGFLRKLDNSDYHNVTGCGIRKSDNIEQALREVEQSPFKRRTNSRKTF